MMSEYRLSATDRSGRSRVAPSGPSSPPPAVFSLRGKYGQIGIRPNDSTCSVTRANYLPLKRSDGAARPLDPPPMFRTAEEAKAHFESLFGIAALGVVLFVGGRWIWRKL
jgi:hypothetical protein